MINAVTAPAMIPFIVPLLIPVVGLVSTASIFAIAVSVTTILVGPAVVVMVGILDGWIAVVIVDVVVVRS